MTVIKDQAKIDKLLAHRVMEAIDEKSLRTKLTGERPLRVKFGADPSSPDLHLGHAVVLHKLREFQDLGHKVVFIIGDYTAMVGDPTGKSKTRPVLSVEDIELNAKTYFEQAGKILDLDPEKLEIRYNSEWFAKMAFRDVIGLAARFTVARMIERDDFEKRLAAGTDVHLHELLYPMMQAYDSVMVDADIEVGSTDQRFNILAGRELQSKMGKDVQDCLFVGPLLVGTDGVKKMSKSLGNYVGLTDSPEEMFGKTMSIPDSALWDWFRLTTGIEEGEIEAMRTACEKGEMNPRDAKMRLAEDVVAEFHSANAARAARESFVAMFQRKEVPDEMPEVAVAEGASLIEALVTAGLVPSKTEARRLIEGGGVKVAGEAVKDVAAAVAFGDGDSLILQKGKRHFVRLIKE
jgi:tyrosyl-tRNA synthetase